MLVSTLRSDFQDYLENDPGPIKKSLGGRSGTLMEAVGWLWSNFDGSRSWSSGYADFITCVGLGLEVILSGLLLLLLRLTLASERRC